MQVFLSSGKGLLRAVYQRCICILLKICDTAVKTNFPATKGPSPN